MNAVTFFAMIKKAHETRYAREALMYAELCDIAAIPTFVSEYYQQLKERYVKRILPKDYDAPRRGALRADDPRAKIMLAQIIAPGRQAYHV